MSCACPIQQLIKDQSGMHAFGVYHAGYPSTVSLVSANSASGGPFGPAATLSAAQGQAGGPQGGGGLSRGKKAAAIAVPVIVGALLAAGKACNDCYIQNSSTLLCTWVGC